MNLTNKLINIINSSAKDDVNHMIASYLKNNLNQISEMKIEDLAKQCSTSIATISRFIRSLGYENYKAFREEGSLFNIEMQKMVTMRNFKKLTPMNSHEFFGQIATSFEQIKLEDIAELAHLLRTKHTGTIYLLGIETTSLITSYISQTSFYTQNKVVVLDQFDGLAQAKPEDTIFLITTTGSLFRYERHLVHLLYHTKAYKFLLTTTLYNNKQQNLFHAIHAVPTCFEPLSRFNVIMLLYYVEMALTLDTTSLPLF